MTWVQVLPFLTDLPDEEVIAAARARYPDADRIKVARSMVITDDAGNPIPVDPDGPPVAAFVEWDDR